MPIRCLKPFAACLLALPLGLACGRATAADEAELLSGTVLKGEVVRDEATDDYIVMHVGDNVVGVRRADLRALTYDTAVRAELEKRRSDFAQGATPAIGARGARVEAAQRGDLDALLEIGRWSREQGLYATALSAYSAALKRDGSNATARAAVEALGKWDLWLAPFDAPAPGAAPTQVADTSSHSTAQPAPTTANAPAATTATRGLRAPAFVSATPARAAEQATYFSTALDAARVMAPQETLADSANGPAPAAPLTAAQQKALAALKAQPGAHAEALALCLQPARVSEAAVRRGALRALAQLRTGRAPALAVSQQLAAAAILDPDAGVRGDAVNYVKASNDIAALRSVTGMLLSSYGSAGEIRSPALNAAAVAGVQAFDDPRILQALLYRVAMELRLTNISEGNLTTRQIDTFSVQSGANQNTIIPVALPIQTPELKITRVNTAVIVPAINALRDVTGQDFGDDWERWGRWVEKHGAR